MARTQTQAKTDGNSLNSGTDNAPEVLSQERVPVKPSRPKFVGVIDHLIRDELEATLLSKRFPELESSLSQDHDALKKDIVGDSPSGLENLLAERIVTCAAHVSWLEFKYVRAIQGGPTLPVGEFWANQCDRATRRLTRSIMALAQVRRLAIPSVQFNIAEKQVVVLDV